MRLRHEQVILMCTLALLVIGLGMVFSASARHADGFLYLKRQLVNAAVGLTVFLCVARVDYRFWGRISRLAILLAFVGLLALFLTEKIRGAQNWILLPGARSFQPVEFARLALILFLGSEMARLGPRLASFRHGFLPMLLVTGSIVLLVIKHNDFGSAMALCLIVFTLFFVGGVRWRHLLGSAGALLVAAVGVAWMRPHVLGRFRAFLHPDTYADSLAYRCLLVLGIFLFLVARAVRVARNQEDPFAQLVALGVGMSIFWYLMINVMVATRLFPVTGLPMPLISYGGSALVSHLFAMGILSNIASRTESPRTIRRRHWLVRRQRAVGAMS